MQAICARLRAMFDAHCHIGTSSGKAIVCTSTLEEFPALSAYPHRSYGLLMPTREAVDALASFLREDKASMLGEVGLDARWPVDEALVEDLLALARELSRPFTLHVVRRHDAMLAMLKRLKPTEPFIVHGFTSSSEIAREYMKLGGVISLGPRAARTRAYRDLIALPFLLESDMALSPDSWAALDGWYDHVAQDLSCDRLRLEEMIDGRIAVFTS